MTKQKAPPGGAYEKAALLASEKYSAQHDLLCALLLDSESYTLDQVNAAIENYMKGGT